MIIPGSFPPIEKDGEIIVLTRKDYDRIDKTIKKCHKAEELLEEALEEKRKSLKKQIIIYGPDSRAAMEIQSSLIEIKSFVSTLQRLKTRGYGVWKS